MLLFWPLERSNLTLRLLFDEEQIAPKQWVYNMIVNTFRDVKSRFPGGIHYTPSAPANNTYRRGHDRQQLMMLWADNYTTAEYIAFADTDCVFLTYVDREDLFEDGKPVINGRSGPGFADWRIAPWITHEFSGLETPMRCMSYFPVILKRSHLADLRAHVVEHWRNTTHLNRTFDEIFFNVTSWFMPFQFDLMCTYLFYFKRNEYKWYAHPYPVSSDWDGINPPKDKYESDFSVFKGIPDIYEPKPLIATHARYRQETMRSHNKDPFLQVVDRLLQQGVCLSPPLASSGAEGNFSFLHRDHTGCEKLNLTRGDDPQGLVYGSRNIQKLGYYHEMYMFEDADWNEQSELRDSGKLRKQYEERVGRIKHCDHKI
jgi:hypothetical protein